MIEYGVRLFAHHAEMLCASGITPEHAHDRGYVSVDTKKQLADRKISAAGRNTPGLLIPQRRSDRSVWGYQYRPDNPRVLPSTGKTVKYETPVGQRNGLDVPPGVGPSLGDPKITLWITEGVKKADAAFLSGLMCVALPGVWSWRGTNGVGGKVAIPDWHDVALDGRRVVLAFDSDVSRKPAVRLALDQLTAYLISKGAKVEFCHLPDDEPGKTGLDDYLADGHTAADLLALVRPDPPPVTEAADHGAHSSDASPERPPSACVVVTLEETHRVFRRWLGDEYDLDALNMALAAAAVERLDGDPLWLLLISGSGNAKTETVQALSGSGALVTSSISSPGALLSASSKRDTAKDATGGLLRSVGSRGVLVIKDVTSILSMAREMRGEVLAALREVYDGRWSRNVGTDGGRTLDWTGRIVVVGAVTTAWDQAHAVISTMGDRFVLLRMDSTVGRIAAGRRAIGNTGDEVPMRAELSDAVAGVLASVARGPGITMSDAETEILLSAANVVTLGRTAVMHDYRGDVIDAHAPEMPTRFAKQLAQVVRGAVAVGMPRHDAMRLAIRAARDSMPPLRLAVIVELGKHPGSSTADVRKQLRKPRATVDRELQALQMLGILEVAEEKKMHANQPATIWIYRLTEGIDPAVLDPNSVPDLSVDTPDPQQGGLDPAVPNQSSVPDLSVDTPKPKEGGTSSTTGVQPKQYPPRPPTDIPGTESGAECRACTRPASPSHPLGLCGATDKLHADAARIYGGAA